MPRTDLKTLDIPFPSGSSYNGKV